MVEQLVGSVLDLLSCVMQQREFHPPEPLAEQIFPMDITTVLTPFS